MIQSTQRLKFGEVKYDKLQDERRESLGKIIAGRIEKNIQKVEKSFKPKWK